MRGRNMYVRFLGLTWSQKSYKRRNLLKNPGKPKYHDVFLTNDPRSFQNSSVIKTGLSDFHFRNQEL